MPPNAAPNVTPNITPGVVPPPSPPTVTPQSSGPTISPQLPPQPTGGPVVSPQFPPQPSTNPMQPMQLNPAYTGNGMPIASLILGIVSLPASILSIFTIAIPIVGIVLGAIGIKKNKGLALAGIILSSIGLIISIGILALGIHTVLNDNKAASSSSSGSVVTTGNSVSTACYTFDLPAPFSNADQKKNQDCVTEFLNTGGVGDLVVNAVPVSQTVSSTQEAAFARAQVNQMESSLGSEFTEILNKTIVVGGQTAYEAVGTEQNTGTAYKYGDFMAVLAPKAYSSTSGSQLQLFIFATDSLTQVSWLDHVAGTWQWK